MFQRRTTTLLALLHCLLLTSTLAQAEPPAYPTFRVPKTATPPVLDGALQPGEWRQALGFTGLVDELQGNVLLPAEMQPTFYLAYDSRYLYLAMRTPHPPGRYPRSTLWNKQDMRIYANDNLQWRICRYDRARVTEKGFGFCQFVINPGGAVLAQNHNGSHNDGWTLPDEWRADMITASQVTAEAWTLEVAVPLYALEVKGLDGQAWVMQLKLTSAYGRPLAAAWGVGDWTTYPEVLFDPQAPAVPVPSDHPLDQPGEQQTKLIAAWRASLDPELPDVPAPVTTTPGVLRIEYERQEHLPVLYRIMDRFLALGDGAEAEHVARYTCGLAPYLPDAQLKLAEVLQRQGKTTEALAALREAARLGADPAVFDDPKRWGDLAGDPEFAKIRSLAAESPRFTPRPARPTQAVDGVAWVRDEDTEEDPATHHARSLITLDLAALRARPVSGLKDAVGDLLRQWYAEGTAAGNAGDLYDNRDQDHSNLDHNLFPQMTFVEYGGAAASLELNYWLAERITHPGIVIGNASLAETTGPKWRSMPRAAYHSPASMQRLVEEYAGNRLFVYPAHRDCLPGHNGKLDGKPGGHGDVYAVNTPYLISSQGSSGLDQPFVRAFAATLAAFRPEVKAFLAEHGALTPTLQMILRQSNAMVEKPEDYLTGAAHPTVFEGAKVNTQKMVELAHAMQRETLPPLVALKVLEEDHPVQGRDFFDEAHPSEALVDTPGAIARIWRGMACRRRMVVSAEGSRDLNGAPLTYHWAVLRGDPQLIQLRTLNAQSSRIEITVAYQSHRPIAPGSGLESNRVDIGAFVNNGTYYSAPAFVCFYTLDNEQREYDAAGRIQSVAYKSGANGGNYMDPLLTTAKDWRDDYHYDAQGQCTGSTRTFPDGHRQEFPGRT